MSRQMKTDRRTGLLAPLRWVFWVSRRFNRVDFRGRTAVTSRLASLGIAFGVMALIAVMSVMNGFQMEYIEAILEVSSYHIQVRGLQDDADEARFASWCSEQPLVQCVLPFAETRGLLVESEWGDEQAAVSDEPCLTGARAPAAAGAEHGRLQQDAEHLPPATPAPHTSRLHPPCGLSPA